VTGKYLNLSADNIKTPSCCKPGPKFLNNEFHILRSLHCNSFITTRNNSCTQFY